MAFRAREGKGLPREPVRKMLIEAVEKRFGTVEVMPAGHLLQFLSDNGSAYIAHEAKHIARSLGLTPVKRPCAARRAMAWPRASSIRSSATMSVGWTSPTR